MQFLAFALISLLPALVITAGLKDLTSMTIPNWISGLLVLGFVPAAWAAGLSPMDAAGHLAVGVAALMIGMGLFATRVIGGGDAKLMAASCLWLGLTGSGIFLLWTAVVGGLFCLAIIVARNQFRALIPAGQGWVSQLMKSDGDIPYGVAIAVGALMAFPTSVIAVGLASLA